MAASRASRLYRRPRRAWAVAWGMVALAVLVAAQMVGPSERALLDLVAIAAALWGLHAAFGIRLRRR